ncbi:MAG: HAD family hydrolase [Spirochaetia bacterium]
MKYRGMFAADFDGTILPRAKKIPPGVYESLETLERENILRVLATGRSLYSLFRTISPDFPVDYVVFSSGAGVLRMSDQRVSMSRKFSEEETGSIAEYLVDRSLDFMIHHPVPDNHRFFYYHSGRENEDFFRRRDHYSDHAVPYVPGRLGGIEASQFLVVDPPSKDEADLIEQELGERVSVVRATSPMDHISWWIEIFPPGTDKGSGIEWVGKRHGLGPSDTAAAGNDYNDLHMLEWAHFSCVVADAPAELTQKFKVIPSCEEAGIVEAVDEWIEQLNRRENVLSEPPGKPIEGDTPQ